MYSLGAYGSMLADRVRVDAYAEALRKTVRKGSIVAEIGTGPGVFAVLACQLGAERVFAIEPGEIIQVAREVAAANGCVGRIEFFEGLSGKVTLPARADVIVSDLRGILPLFEGHIPAIVDARHRFLAAGGAMIPRRDTLWAAIVEAPKPYGEVVDPWERNPFGQNLRPARELAVNGVQKVRLGPADLLTAHKLWATLDYGRIENPDVRSDLEWTVERAGTGHGIVVWFDADLAESVAFSNAPGTPETVYGSLFFPWRQSVPLERNQTVCMGLEAKLLGNDYIWRWATRVIPLGGSEASPPQFEQSQLGGAVLSPQQLHRLAADHVPELSEEGLLRRRTFELMDGRASLAKIAHQLLAEFPHRFSSLEQALSYAGLISREFSR